MKNNKRTFVKPVFNLKASSIKPVLLFNKEVPEYEVRYLGEPRGFVLYDRAKRSAIEQDYSILEQSDFILVSVECSRSLDLIVTVETWQEAYYRDVVIGAVKV